MPLKTTVKRAVNRLGYKVVRLPRENETSSLAGEVRPLANYTPWNADKAFLATFAAIQGFTLVDVYRCYELWKLVEQTAKLRAGSIIEIGVWRGGTGALLATQARNCGVPDPVFLCDTFTGVVKAGDNDSAYKGGEHADTTRETVERLVRDEMRLDNVEILEGIFPDQTGPRVENVAFRLCHIDVDVYQSAKDIVHYLWDKMIRGGIMVYDDYGFTNCDGITKFVEEQMVCDDRLIIHNLNGHAVVVKM